jgi:hypothetical protein
MDVIKEIMDAEDKVTRIIIDKNRGWRGLAQVKLTTNGFKIKQSMIFSFSQDVWDDMLKGFMVLQDDKYYYVVQFDNTDELPKGQRSVLLKHFTANVEQLTTYPKSGWSSSARDNGHYPYIMDFINNSNNHTTSDWNHIGIRVVPMI